MPGPKGGLPDLPGLLETFKMDTKTTGGCLCGSVRYETTGNHSRSIIAIVRVAESTAERRSFRWLATRSLRSSSVGPNEKDTSHPPAHFVLFAKTAELP